jgi:hypothetical protein
MNWHEVVENCVVQVGIHPLRFDKELEREIPKGCERTKKEAPDRLRKHRRSKRKEESDG